MWKIKHRSIYIKKQGQKSLRQKFRATKNNRYNLKLK